MNLMHSLKFSALMPVLVLCTATYQAPAQTAAAKVEVPDWALPGSATHKQVPPPADFHRVTRTDNTHIGIFEGQSDVGAALVPGPSSFNEATRKYIIVSAGYNVGYSGMNSVISGRQCPAIYLWRLTSISLMRQATVTA